MMCKSPISIKDPSSKKATVRLSVPCGKCFDCMSNRRNEWVTRLEQESKLKKTWFVTLTYSDENLRLSHLPAHSVTSMLSKRDVQLFIKKLRKKRKSERLKYYLVGEFGSRTGRPHYHMILFGMNGTKEEVTVDILKAWDLGRIDVQECNSKAMNYTLKYMCKPKVPYSKFKKTLPKIVYDCTHGFALMSKNLGIRYVEQRAKWHEEDINRNYVIKENGNKHRLPRYYKEKIYSKAEQELQGIIANDRNIEKWQKLTNIQQENQVRTYISQNVQNLNKTILKINETL